MHSTDKVLGQIAAIQTLIENFPMSILDMYQGKRYTSAFEFIVDILNACGVNTNEIIEYILEVIYGVEEKVEGGIQGLYDNVKTDALKIDEQSPFLETLEYGIKGVLMALLSSIFGCSALPYLYDNVLDADRFVGKAKGLPELNGLYIPTKAMDIMGMLGINPTSEEGQLYYFTGGSTKYYRKELIPVEIISAETRTSKVSSVITVYDDVEEPLYTEMVRIGIRNIYRNEDPFSECAWDFFICDENGNEVTASTINNDIKIFVNYNSYGSQSSNNWIGTISARKTKTNEELYISPEDSNKKPSRINYISINNQGTGVRDGENTWVYLDKESSWKIADFYKNWESLWDNNNWGAANTGATITVKREREVIVEKDEEYIVSSTTIVNKLQYIECTAEEANEGKKKGKTITHVLRLPEKASEDDSDYISCYDGLMPNELYKSMDMNAFIWYAINKGMNEPQVEHNHMMWDSRVSAAKSGVGRKNPQEWNNWYATKKNEDEEFLYIAPKNDSETFRITEKDALYPILQIEKPTKANKNYLKIYMPSQRYYKPKYREDMILGDASKGVTPDLTLNSTLYKFDWDYLMNIQIIHPKIMIVRMCEYLLNLSLTTAGSLNFNTTRELIKAKVMSAAQKIIEADDTEIEDCYMSFSNEEYDAMINEMIYSKYSATKYNGEVNKAIVHDTAKYTAMINDINSNATKSGTTSSIKRLVTEVTTTGENEEPTLSYGIQVSTNENLLKQLLWAFTMPIVESILTPQVMLLFLINLEATGLVNLENNLFEHDFGKIFNVILNKILGLTKSIIVLIKNEIIILLLKLFEEKVLPLLIEWKLIIYLEMITYWLVMLKSALNCLPTFQFPKIISSIDDVNYADIDNSQKTPESTSLC